MAEDTTNINKGVEIRTQKAALELFNGTGLVFSIINNHQATLSAQITDNFIENNTSLHDHIAIQPITVTLTGLVGDIVLTSEAAAQQIQDELEQAKARTRLSGNFFRLSNYTEMLTGTDSSSLVATKLGTFGSLVPQMSNATKLAVGFIQQAYSAANRSLVNKWQNQNNAALNNTPITQQESIIKEAYARLRDTFYSKSPNKVITPWETYENMYIQSLEISQDEKNFVVDVSVTLKQLRFSSVQYTKANEEVLNAYAADAQAKEEDCGKLESTLHKMESAGTNIGNFISSGLSGLGGVN